MNTKILILVIALTSMVGCTTMMPVDEERAEIAAQVEPGDHVVAYERSGRIVDMTVTMLEADTIRGELTNGGGPVSITISDVEKMEVEKVDGVKTTFAVVGGAIVIVPLAVLALLVGGYAQGY